MAARGAVPVQGFEPRVEAAKTAVLPLDDTGAEPSEGVEPTSLVYETSALAAVLRRRRCGLRELHPYPQVGSLIRCCYAKPALG